MPFDPSQIRPDWLLERMPTSDPTTAMRHALLDAGMDAATAERMATNPPPRVRADWAAFVRRAAPGDELWYFRSPRGELAGRAGFAFVRSGTPIAAHLTSMG
jgi:hypothetical protein